MKTYHILQYVENCSTKTKVFKTKAALKAFKTRFLKRHPPEPTSDHWLMMSIFDITGSIETHDDSIEID